MGNIVKTAKCRFCGQMTQIEADEELTAAQAEEQAKASNYDPAQITIACEADCSSGVAAIVKGAGYRLGNEKMKNVSIYLYTGNMRAGLKAAGFEVLTDSKYLTSDAYLLIRAYRQKRGRHPETGVVLVL